MAQIVIPQTVNPPSPAPETVAPLDFSKLFSDYTQGAQFAQQQAIHKAFAGGIPTTDGTPNGPTDYGAVFRRFMQVGDYDDANKAMQTGIQMQGMQNTNATNSTIRGDGAPAATGATPASPINNNAPSPYLQTNSTAEAGGLNPTAHNPDNGPPGSSAYGIIGFMPATWAGLVKDHPELNLPADITKSTLDQQIAAANAYTGENALYLAQHGLPVTDQTARMANFLGADGAVHFFGALRQNGGAIAAPLFPAEAAANHSSFYAPDGTPLTLGQVFQKEVIAKGFGPGNTTGFNYRPLPQNQVASAGGPVARAADGTPVQTNTQGQAIDPATGQPVAGSGGTVVPRANVRITNGGSAVMTAPDGTSMAVPANRNPAVGALSTAPKANAAQDGGTVPGGAASATGGAAAANAARNAAALTPGNGTNVGQQLLPIGPYASGTPAPQELAQGDSSGPVVGPSYAQNLSSPPPSNPSSRGPGGAAASSQPSAQLQTAAGNNPVSQPPGQAASATSPVNGTNDPTLSGLVPRGLVAKFKAEGIPPEQWAGNAAAYLTTAAASPGTPPATAEAWRQLAGEIGQTLRLRSTPNPALKEIDAERETDPTTGQPETNSQVIARIAQAKAAAEAQGKTSVEIANAGPIAEQQSVGKALGELPAKLADAASSGKLQNNTLDEMQTAAEGFRMGWGAQSVQDAKSILQGLSQMVGVQPPDMTNSVGSYQDFLKLAGNISRQASHETSSRVGVQEMTLINKSLPSPEMSPDGFRLVASQIKGQNDFSIAKQQAAGQWAASHGNSLAGFETDWNKNTSPAAFVFTRMSHENPVIYNQMVSNMGAQPGGKTVLKNIKGEMTWANQNGLLGE